MHNEYDYKKFAVLYVDDEERSLKYFSRAFQDQFRILTANSAQAGFNALEEHKDDIAVLITDQRMPGEKGTWLLEKARQLRPRIVRILATAFSDMDAAVAAVNTGAIYKYVTKPWDPPQLDATLKRAMEFFIVQRERDGTLGSGARLCNRTGEVERLCLNQPSQRLLCRHQRGRDDATSALTVTRGEIVLSEKVAGSQHGGGCLVAVILELEP